jgi:hypothetical protein
MSDNQSESTKDAVSVSRRTVLAAVGGITGVVGVGYATARSLARYGTVNGRLVIGYQMDDGIIVSPTDIFREYIDADGPPDRRFNSDYREHLPAELPITVSASAHRALQQEFDEVVFALSHHCPSADCSTPQVNRDDFNQAKLGEEVGLLYHSGDSATLIR